MCLNIPTPSEEQVSEYRNLWDLQENYVRQESSLIKLFTETYPLNNDMDDVLIKVCSLNDFYSTNIFSPFKVSRHIVDLDIDQRLVEQDQALVNDIAVVKVNGQKTINFYSFATKYCSHHSPEYYPIYDYYVEKMLMHFKRTNDFYQFRKGDLKCYPKYCTVLREFRNHYGLDSFTSKDVDKYLWQAGKEYFPRQYQRR